MKFKVLGIALFAFFSIYLSAQQTPSFSSNQKVGIYEHLDTLVSHDIFLTNIADSSQVNLKSLIDKPTVFSFVYYNCPGLCSPLLGGITEVIDKTDLVLGEDYQVITISMNEDDYPTLGRKKKSNYVKSFTSNVDESHWIWLTGDSTNIAKASQNLGFRFLREGKDFAHAAAIIVASPDGKVTRYLHGTYFLPFDFKMAIVEASKGISGPAINKVLEFCFSYDPQGKKYVFNVTKISGSIILGLALILFLVLSLKKRKTKSI